MKKDDGLPVSLDYFKATGDYASFFHEEYGEKPTKIQIIFVSDDEVESCMEEWDGRDKDGRRAGYGDGQEFCIWDGDLEDYVAHEDQARIKDLTKEKGIKWSVVLTLNFVIPKIRGVFGLWRFQTRGNNSSIVGIRNTFDEIKDKVGIVAHIPFDLVVKKVVSQKPGSKFRFPVVSLVPNLSAENLDIVRGYIESGIDLKRVGVITEAQIRELESAENKALPEGK